MPVSFVSPRHFSGAGRVHETGQRGLAAIVRNLSADLARVAVANAAIPALTDNSGGATADGTVNVIGVATKAVLGATDAAQTAATIAALGTVTDALTELAAKANAIAVKVPVGTLTDSMAGTAADGTIGAVTVALTGVGASMASAVKVNLALAALTNRLSTIVGFVNVLSVATNTAPMVDATGGTRALFNLGSATVLAALPEIAAITGATGADVTDANAVVKVTDMNLRLVALAGAVKEVATKLNAIVNASTGYLVVNTIALA